MKYEAVLKCDTCGAFKNVWLDKEEFQNHVERVEDGIKIVCSNCTWVYEKEHLEVVEREFKGVQNA